MKKTTLALGLIFAGATIVSCGGGAEKSSENTNNEAAVEAAPEASAAATTEVQVNTEASVVNWKGSMVGMYEHFGTIKLSEGKVMMEGDKITAGNFVVDMTTIVPTDENYNEENTAEKLVGHLGSPDFFDVANNPTASFEITGMDEAGNITGNLTVRGKTNPETITNVTMDAENGTMSGTLVFDRQKYDVAYKATMKDMVLSDDIELTITLVKA